MFIKENKILKYVFRENWTFQNTAHVYFFYYLLFSVINYLDEFSTADRSIRTRLFFLKIGKYSNPFPFPKQRSIILEIWQFPFKVQEYFFPRLRLKWVNRFLKLEIFSVKRTWCIYFVFPLSPQYLSTEWKIRWQWDDDKKKTHWDVLFA